MKKILPICIVGILVISGLGAAAINVDTSTTTHVEKPIAMKTMEITKSITFSEQPIPTVEKGFVNLDVQGANSWSMEPGKPILPIYIANFEVPKEAQNIKVVCTPTEITTMDIPGEIAFAQTYRRSDYNTEVTPVVKDDTIYTSAELYPDSWYNPRITFGRNVNDELVYAVDVICNVVRYSPTENKVEYIHGMDITVTYDYPEGGTTTSSSTEYDLVIIAPQKFEAALQPLIEHKNSYGVNTILKTVEDILSEYTTGYDAPENIKYFIKYALDTWNITYVLLVGGLKSHINADDKDDESQGTEDWYVPVRYENIEEGDEKGCISDLYYGDIYDNETNFSSWETNGNHIYGEWGTFAKDNMDMRPEVYVGRLPCSNTLEVKFMVKRIINYEKTPPSSKPWFNTMIGIGGKTFAIYLGQPDGEYVCNVSIDYMGSLITNPVRVYTSNNGTGGPRPITNDIIREISKGAGYVDFEGHGNPITWNTIWADGQYEHGDWAGGVNLYDFWRIHNGNKLPVVIVGGCHNALFNISLFKTMNKNLPKTWYWTYGMPAPVCFSWGLCLIPWGGAIASTGCTGYGIGYSGLPLSLSAQMEANFFYQIGQNGVTNLGKAHSLSISKFIDENTIGQVESHCMAIYQIFGDPSLKLGGYA